MKSAILLFILGSFGLPVANAADYGSEHQGFVKVQQALDYAEFQLVVNKALEQLRLFQGSVVCRIFMGWSAEEGFESWLKSSLADMSVVQPALHVSLNRLRSLYSRLSERSRTTRHEPRRRKYQKAR